MTETMKAGGPVTVKGKTYKQGADVPITDISEERLKRLRNSGRLIGDNDNSAPVNRAEPPGRAPVGEVKKALKDGD
ncbi:hypothetical protein J7443_17580 [Tropicibacter sp. R15_0]|uniref:hypothetical protein n=1 Tax=Tropicibacter sp. R15_0 TaxID=2821101 RepID=UPI001ADBA73F|nr:hypothetical protein [Tropicibacter sp. R15_0]MBO9467059.1 hypothetical protein [Tropicibacter sp. R15_0]